MLRTDERLSIGDLVQRSGLAASALRYYEDEGLISAERNQGGHRRYSRSTLRRIAFIRAAQKVGLTLGETREILNVLPGERTPNKSDWTRVSMEWRDRLNYRIAALEQLRDKLTGCIGCGCLSLKECALSNPEDSAALKGSGARYLLVNTQEMDN